MNILLFPVETITKGLIMRDVIKFGSFCLVDTKRRKLRAANKKKAGPPPPYTYIQAENKSQGNWNLSGCWLEIVYWSSLAYLCIKPNIMVNR